MIDRVRGAVPLATIGITVIIVALWGITTPLPAVMIAWAVATAFALFLVPKVAVAVLAGFLVFQPVLINLVGGIQDPLGLALQRLDEAILLAGLGRICLLFGSHELPRESRYVAVLTAAFLLMGVTSALLADVPLRVWVLGAFLSVKFPIFVLLALSVRWNENDAQRLTRLGLWLGPILLALGVLLWMSPTGIQELFLDPGAEREGFFARGDLRSMQGIFTHPGVFGWALAVTGCYAAASVLSRRSRTGTLGLVASVMGILASLRRKPLIGLPLSIAVGVIRFGTNRQRFAVLGLIATLAGGVALFGATRVRAMVEDTVITYGDANPGTTARTLLYITGFDIAKDRFPLGAGFGRFGGFVSSIYYSPLYDQYGLSSIRGLSSDEPDYIEDTYWPHVLGEAGWAGTTVLLSLLVLLWRSAAITSTTGGSLAARCLAMAASMVLIEALVESVAAPIFEASLPAYVIAIPLGMAIVLRKGPRLMQDLPQDVEKPSSRVSKSAPTRSPGFPP